MKMITSQTLQRLQWHAGLLALPTQSSPSLCEATWRGSLSTESIESAVQDVVSVLACLNHEINGEMPSEATDKCQSLDRRLVYAVSEILRLLKQDNRTPENLRACLARSEWMIGTAWLAVLSGDIDDINEHLSEQEMARGE